MREVIKILKLTTFEDIFNKLIEKYQGKTVKIHSRQDGIKIADLTITVGKITIKPLNKTQSKKWNSKGQKVGLIIIKNKNKYNKNTINIPFLLGFNTMSAVFLKQGVTIKSLDFEFNIKNISTRQKPA